MAALPDGEERLAHALLEDEMSSGSCPSDGVAGGAINSLPFTGISAFAPALAGAGLVLTGLVVLRVARDGSGSAVTPDE
ncbi:MAG: hypothetical protein WD895_04820 [Acidimicrobiia bacterium]